MTIGTYATGARAEMTRRLGSSPNALGAIATAAMAILLGKVQYPILM